VALHGPLTLRRYDEPEVVSQVLYRGSALRRQRFRHASSRRLTDGSRQSGRQQYGHHRATISSPEVWH
jgi:hypothetical protein